MNTTYRPFFMYGTLRPGQTNCEAILGPHLKEAIPARLSGYKMLLTPSYPMAIPSKEDQITGDVIYVSEANFDSLLADMDELEGYLGDEDPNNLYTRVITHPTISEGENAGQKVECYLYVATENALDQNSAYTEESASGDWLKRPDQI